MMESTPLKGVCMSACEMFAQVFKDACLFVAQCVNAQMDIICAFNHLVVFLCNAIPIGFLIFAPHAFERARLTAPFKSLSVIGVVLLATYCGYVFIATTVMISYVYYVYDASWRPEHMGMVVYKEKTATDPWWLASHPPIVWLMIYELRKGPWNAKGKAIGWDIALLIARYAYMDYKDIVLDNILYPDANTKEVGLLKLKPYDVLNFQTGIEQQKEWFSTMECGTEFIRPKCIVCARPVQPDGYYNPLQCPKHASCINCYKFTKTTDITTKCVVCKGTICCGHQLVIRNLKTLIMRAEDTPSRRYACYKCKNNNAMHPPNNYSIEKKSFITKFIYAMCFIALFCFATVFKTPIIIAVPLVVFAISEASPYLLERSFWDRQTTKII